MAFRTSATALWTILSSRAGSPKPRLPPSAFGMYTRSTGFGQFRRLGDQRGIAESVVGLGAVAAFEGRAESAARLFGAAEASLETLGAELWPSNRGVYERSVAAARTALDPAVVEAAW